MSKLINTDHRENNVYSLYAIQNLKKNQRTPSSLNNRPHSQSIYYGKVESACERGSCSLLSTNFKVNQNVLLHTKTFSKARLTAIIRFTSCGGVVGVETGHPV